MKVIHIESGLGNQMLSYCEYLALKKIHPEEKCYIETLIFDIPECNDYVCQWNGYELNRIFGITAPNIKECFNEHQWKLIKKEIIMSEFWKHEWNWPVYFQKAFEKQGLVLHNIRGDFELNKDEFSISKKESMPLKYRIKQTGVYSNIRRIYKSLNYKKYVISDYDNIFYKGTEDALTGQRLSFKNKNNGIESIESEIKQAFKFPNISDENNLKYKQIIKSCESVAIHARRGDMLSVNGKYYKSGYFSRAIKFIKKNIKSPVFLFFCDPGSISWCKEHSKIFGLDFKKDKVYFVDCNSGENNFKDMQLMSMCKHNVITNSSFGWWGAYLNDNAKKITISPEIEINTTNHF